MDEPGRVDGRTARGQRTRSAVVDALLALQEEGDLEPTAQGLGCFLVVFDDQDAGHERIMARSGL